MRSSTRVTPSGGAQAIPAISTDPAATDADAAGTSIRELVLTGPYFDQPRGTQ